jgi:hypothetical protein
MMDITISSASGDGQKEKYSKHDVKHWADIIQQAEEIKADKEKMDLVSPLLHHKVNSIKGLRKLATKKINAESMPDKENAAEEMDPNEE